MPSHVKTIPEGFHSITPYLIVNDAARAIDFYKRAFGATELMKMPGPGGKIAHAEIKIGDSVVMISDETPGNQSPQSLGGSCVGIMLYVNDVDVVFERAKSAGAKQDAAPANMFWGDRHGRLTDPFGHKWSLATHIEDVAPEEMAKRMKEATAKAGEPVGSAV
jgi:PhnB protein